MNTKKPVHNKDGNSSDFEPFSKNSKEIFNQLIKYSFDIVVLLDENGNQTFVSPSCEYILGYKQKELTNLSVIDEMIHPDDKEYVRQALNEIITEKSNGGAQYRHLHKDGHWVYLEAFGNNLLDDPVINSVVLNVRDITERKNAEKQLLENEKRLKELNATKDRFISIIGHDLKNPFNTIIGFSELLLDDIINDNYSDIQQYAQIINDSSHRVNQLLNNLLKWSRTQSGKISFKPEEFNLVHVLHDIQALLSETARNKNIAIELPDYKEQMIKADVDMTHTILRNLISNGIKFTPKGGKVSVQINASKDKTVVSVTDNGIGLKKEKLDNLFRIESNETTTGTNGEKGTGFGLLLAKEFVDMHNGEIWAEKNEGKGVTFKFSLPSN